MTNGKSFGWDKGEDVVIGNQLRIAVSKNNVGTLIVALTRLEQESTKGSQS
jgi:hypothetical protein